MLVNNERFKPEEYGSEAISRYSSIKYVQFDETTPNWAAIDVVPTELQDESTLLQLGYDEVTDLFLLEVGPSQASSWNNHPSVNATGLYKFVSI